jgi:hypothetical protein
MNQEHHSSKQEVQVKELEKKLERLEKIIELQQRTRDHDKKFGKYEMM